MNFLRWFFPRDYNTEYKTWFNDKYHSKISLMKDKAVFEKIYAKLTKLPCIIGSDLNILKSEITLNFVHPLTGKEFTTVLFRTDHLPPFGGDGFFKISLSESDGPSVVIRKIGVTDRSYRDIIEIFEKTLCDIVRSNGKVAPQDKIL